MKKMNQASEIWDIIRYISIQVMGIPEREERKEKKYSKKKMVESFPNLLKSSIYTSRKLKKFQTG